MAEVCLAQQHLQLETILTKEFPKDSEIDGRWVYEKDLNEIEIVTTHLTELLPEHKFFKTQMVKYLGWHTESSECLILLNQKESDVLLVEPVWYGGISEEFIQLFIGHKFESEKEMKKFVFALQDLLLIGSEKKHFRETSINKNSVIFDLYDENNVWRNIIMTFDNGSLVDLTSTNLKTKEKKIIQ
ncbi:MAG: hypothetical protein AAGL34_07180 [Bacteroidota bacterium]